MRYKDLPPIEESTKTLHYYYNFDLKKKPAVFLKHGGKFSRHKNIDVAYHFLSKNPELETCDKFFGNGFPFLCGRTMNVYLKEELPEFFRLVSFVIHGLKIEKNLDRVRSSSILNDCDFQIGGDGTMVKPVNFSKHDTLFASSYLLKAGTMAYFAAKTHNELAKRFNILEVMSA